MLIGIALLLTVSGAGVLEVSSVFGEAKDTFFHLEETGVAYRRHNGGYVNGRLPIQTLRQLCEAKPGFSTLLALYAPFLWASNLPAYRVSLDCGNGKIDVVVNGPVGLQDIEALASMFPDPDERKEEWLVARSRVPNLLLEILDLAIGKAFDEPAPWSPDKFVVSSTLVGRGATNACDWPKAWPPLTKRFIINHTRASSIRTMKSKCSEFLSEGRARTVELDVVFPTPSRL